ncbi:hypothetical protein [Emticicia soli]|uniref:Uncharacterized protein n=1 Tax=Emticicia soli TaxID=2027878 RepID=A0ABW5J3X7_9BACT
MKNTTKISIALGLVALVTGIMLWFYSQKPQAFVPEEVDATEELSDRNMVRIQVDSLTNIIQQVYGNEATISMPDGEAYVVKVQNQGNEISNFYNDNPRLLEVKDERFSIKRTGNSLEANFMIERIQEKQYAFVPTDVVYKLAELAYNK